MCGSLKPALSEAEGRSLGMGMRVRQFLTIFGIIALPKSKMPI